MITRNTDYALRAVSYIAGKDKKIISVAELVKKLSIPRPFLRKLLQVLNKEKILVSQKGSGGGFILAKPVNKIFLLDLVKIFQGELKINECFLKKSICPNIKTCALRKKILTIEKFAYSQLKDVTLGVLMRES
ncbi:MAG: Rrf2 family transcriptional regulator [Candidatus Omnitrophica bacterium]|nr:Rrf2 family transcriptional regulator [Candidatus Omnitrophota bacterium]